MSKIGFNDADYPLTQTIDGKRVKCPFYTAWYNMMYRCYSGKKVSYKDCSVSPDWHSFMSFRSWMEKQDWKGKHLDKDLLVEGNKLYSKDTCLFISEEVNKFMPDCKSARGNYPVGVYFDKKSGKYKSQCRDKGAYKHIGLFVSSDDACEAYTLFKYNLAMELALEQDDSRVSQALINRYKPKPR